jgi:hypothetical protein
MAVKVDYVWRGRNDAFIGGFKLNGVPALVMRAAIMA